MRPWKRLTKPAAASRSPAASPASSASSERDHIGIYVDGERSGLRARGNPPTGPSRSTGMTTMTKLLTPAVAAVLLLSACGGGNDNSGGGSGNAAAAGAKTVSVKSI